MYFQVVDAKGEVVKQGRDLLALQQGLAGKIEESFTAIPTSGLERDNIKEWDFGDLPEVVEIEQHGFTLKGYPALVCTGKDGALQVALKVMDTREGARLSMRRGLACLFMLQQQKEVNYLRKNIPAIQKSCMHYASMGSCEKLKQDLVTAIVDEALLGDGSEICTEQEYKSRSMQACGQLMVVANKYGALVQEILSEHHAVVKRLKGNITPAFLLAMADIKEQLGHLVYSGFITKTPFIQLCHLPRYLKAIQRRLEKLQQGPERDRQLMAEITPLWQQYLERAGSQAGVVSADPDLEVFRWMLEELRVSLFAQELKTPYPVSVKRLQKQWQKVK
jgi:ATP-dependent helicase HrpA